MAESEQGERPIQTGLEIPITVEQFIPGAVIVCLKHDSKVYRGVLMDTTNR